MESLSSYSNVTTADCENILSIIQKEFELQKKNHEYINKIQEEIGELTAQRNILSKRKKFNEKWCILCCSSLLFRRKIQCPDCRFWVCRSCASWEDQYKTWICGVCEKQRHLDAESWAWFYNQLRLKFSHFGSAKVLKNLCQRKKLLDSENDSGYGPSCDYKSLLSLFSSNSKQTNSMADCEDDDEEEMIGEEETEIRHSIEYIVSGLLGSTLDDASVDRMYLDSEYERIFTAFHSQLINAIQNLSNSLRRALHNLPHADGISPTVALASLKHLITTVDKECDSLPHLQTPPKNETDYDLNSSSMSLVEGDIFSLYEGLVASAIINKVVENNQLKYLKPNEDVCLQTNENDYNSKLEVENNSVTNRKESKLENDESCQGFTEEQLPLECVQIEEVEEITREYTDSDDDRYSSVSHQSSCLQSIDKLSMERSSSEIDLLYASEQQNDGKTPFPEFGPDLVDDIDKIEDNAVCYPIAVTSWEENWLFRKKRRLPLYSNLKYQLLTYCDEPPCMLIPCPSENNDKLEKEESLSSELSETHSVGSLEFSSDGEANVSNSNSQDLQSSIKNPLEEIPQSVFTTEKFVIKDTNNVDESTFSDTEECKSDLQNYKGTEVCSQIISEVKYTLDMHNSCQFSQQNHESGILHKISNKEIASHEDEPPHNAGEKGVKMDTDVVDGIFQIPTQPGTIAEREHKKWLNAVPLKNNPYSAENISRRNSTPHKSVILNNAASFKEFEKQLKEMSHLTSKEPFEIKLNCGLKSIDKSLYKRDYYVNQFDLNNHGKDFNHITSLPNFEPFNNDSNEGVPEETLNSLEEKVYISAGKVFTLENHVKRLERELKDMCLLPQDRQSLPQALNLSNKLNTKSLENLNLLKFSSNAKNSNLPSVKILATKFTPPDKSVQVVFPVENESVQKANGEKVKKTRPCVKVHSLTARSLSREFRDRAKQNIPKPMNRFGSVPSQLHDETTSEQESLCSPCSASSPINIPQNELVHGYTSDESSTSTNSLPRLKTRRHISRSILQRASYWERRAEQGLLSDASVSEEFPGLETNTN